MRHLLTDLRGNPIYVMSRAARLRTRGASVRHPHLPTLFYHVQNRSWPEVIRRAKSHPHEVTIQEDGSKNTSLHVACRLNPPTEVIWALRKAARMKNSQGATPLHIAASHRISKAALDVLLECAAAQPAHNESAANNMMRPNAFLGPQFNESAYKSTSPTADLSRCGRAPIHYACMSFRGLESDAFQTLLEATLKDGFVVLDNEAYSKRLLGLDEFFTEDEEGVVVVGGGMLNNSMASFDSSCSSISGSNHNASNNTNKKIINVMTIRDSTGQTPLGLLFCRYRERMKCVINRVDRLWREHADNPTKASLAAAISVHAELGELWQRARFILARLTQERIQKETNGTVKDVHNGTTTTKTCFMDMDQPLSPGELAVAQEAASWAAEQHMAVFDSLPLLEQQQEARDESPIRSARSSAPFRILHSSVALIGYGCPPEMIRLAISLHPQQVREMDEAGNLPIHIAATARSYLATHCAGATNDRYSLQAAAAAAVAASDEDSLVSDATGVLSFFSSATVSQTINAFDKVIKILLQHYPESAKIPQGKTGQLPLVMAVEAGCRSWDDGLQTLLTAYPPALHNRKLFSLPLYPKILAMVNNSSGKSGMGGLGFGSKHDNSRSPMRTVVRSPRKRNHKGKKDSTARKMTTMFELLKVKPELLVSTRKCE